MSNAEPETSLSAGQAKAARMLVYGALTTEEIAEACAVSAPTIRRWRQLDAFRAHVAKLQRERDDQARRESAGLMADAAAVARDGLDVAGRMLRAAKRAMEEGGPVDLRPSDVSSLIGAAHALLKTTSAQVGPVERSAVEATVQTVATVITAETPEEELRRLAGLANADDS